MIFLGTGAAELVPSPFCDCKVCTVARERKGIYLKKRSCFMLDESILFDFGPDLPVACMYHDVNLSRLKHVFITHTHPDHLLLSNIWLLQASKLIREEPVFMYMSKEAFAYCTPGLQQMARENRYDIRLGADGCDLILGNGNKVNIRIIAPYTHLTIAGMEVYAIQSNHETSAENEYAFNYCVTMKNGKKLLYACDTGLYSESNLQALKNVNLDYLIMEATGGILPLDDDSQHLNGELFVRQINMMFEHHIVSKHTKVYSTHLCQAQEGHHDDLQRYFDEHCQFKVIVAYDGLNVDL